MDAVMDEVIQKYRIGSSHPEEVIASEWVNLVGEKNARHANPLRLDRNNRLFIFNHHAARSAYFF